MQKKYEREKSWMVAYENQVRIPQAQKASFFRFE